jgi:DNA-binding transcriptional regulator LsrR (DeoR family)
MSRVYSNERLAIKVCRLFFEENLTKIEIEKRLNISRFKVARILKNARQVGLVKIQIAEPKTDLTNLEVEIERELRLKSVVLAYNNGESAVQLKKKIGVLAAQYVLDVLRPGDTLGVGWGTTTFEFVNALPDKINAAPQIVQVSGGNTAIEPGIDSQTLTVRLGHKFGVEPHLLHAPTIVDRAETRDLLLKETAFKRIFDIYKEITVVLAGIGAFVPDGFIGSRNMGAEERRILERKKAVGEYLTYCFDLDGNYCDTGTLNRTIAIPLGNLKRVPCTIGIAAGEQKADAILGVIRSGVINTLITDSNTAMMLLKSAKGGPSHGQKRQPQYRE